jgi:mRNA-degrading endonuclease toxin of MazEF toxin-antitoxin module
VRRGEIWTAARAGHERRVVIVGHDALTEARESVLVVPISDVRVSTLIEPSLADTDGRRVGVAMTPRVGEVTKSYLTTCSGVLAPPSVESLDVALRAALDL